MRSAVPAVVLALMLSSGVGAASASAASASARAGAAGPASSSHSALQKEPAAEAALRKARFGIPARTSPNWSGYVDSNYKTSGGFNWVAAHWHVPEVASGECAHNFSTDTGMAGFWIGLDGWNGTTVEQTGTVTECYQGNAYYFAWYEMYPSPLVVLWSVNPGDVMDAAVSDVGGTYHLWLTDLTSGAHNQAIETCPSGSSCLDRSAEVVAEAPGGCVSGSGQTCRVVGPASLYPMENFQWVRFYSISVGDKHGYTGGPGASTFGPLDVTMKGTGGSGFTDAVVSTTLSKQAFSDSWKFWA